MKQKTDGGRTLDELDPPAWDEPVATDTHLVKTCHRLRKKPIGDFSVEDLRIMIGQAIGLEVLIPLALHALEQEPLLEGDFFPGDLLLNVLRVDPGFWRSHPKEATTIRALLARVEVVPRQLHEALAQFRSHTA
jgi:hypothetical protein